MRCTFIAAVSLVFLTWSPTALPAAAPLVEPFAAPGPPQWLTGASWDSEARLYWEAPATGDPSYYNVYRSTTYGGGYVQVNSGPVTGRQYVDSGVSNGTTYYYVVTAVDGGGESAYSNQTNAAPGPVSGGQNASGTIMTTTVWRLRDTPITVTGDIAVDSGNPSSPAYLMIEPGVEVRVQAGFILRMGTWANRGAGVLQARGAGPANIRFTYDGAGAPGSWQGLTFQGLASTPRSLMRHTVVEYAGKGDLNNGTLYVDAPLELDFCTVRQSGNEGLYTTNPPPGISIVQDCQFLENTGFHVVMPVQFVTGFSGNAYDTQLLGGGDQAIILYGGPPVEDSGVWEATSVPYQLSSGSLRIDNTVSGSRVEITFEAGVRILFGTNSQLVVGGSVSAGGGYIHTLGIDTDPVVFEPLSVSWGGVLLQHDDSAAKPSNLEGTVIRSVSNADGRAVYVANTAANLTSCTIEGSNGYGLQVAATDPADLPTVQGCTFQNNANYHIRVRADGVGHLSGNTYDSTLSGGGSQAILLTQTNLQDSATWEAAGIPYRIDPAAGNLLVQTQNGHDVVLTLEGGCVIEMPSDAAIYVGSTAAGPNGVLQTVPGADPQARTILRGQGGGTWEGLFIYRNDTTPAAEIRGLDITGGGEATAPVPADLLVMNGAGLSVVDCGLQDSLGYGLQLTGPTYPSISQCRFSNNANYHVYTPFAGAAHLTRNTFDVERAGGAGPQAIEVLAGTLSESGTWGRNSVPYHLDGNYVIDGAAADPAATLTISAGADLALGDATTLRVGDSDGTYSGGLMVKGSATRRVVFHPWLAGTHWGALQFNVDAVAPSQVEYADFVDGGQGQLAMLLVSGPGPAFERCRFQGSLGYAVHVWGTGEATFHYTDFSANASGAINRVGSATLDAELCYWSASDGPGGDGSGSGEAVFGSVDFDPYFTTTLDDAFSLYDFVIPAPIEPGGPDEVLEFKAPGQIKWDVSLAYLDDQRVVSEQSGGSLNATPNTQVALRRKMAIHWDAIDQNSHQVPADDFTFDLTIQQTMAGGGRSLGLHGTFQVANSTIVRLDTPLDGDFFGAHNVISVSGTAAGTGFASYTLAYRVDGGGWQDFYTSSNPVIDGNLIDPGWDIPEVTGSNVDLRVQLDTLPDNVTSALQVISPHSIAALPNPFGPNPDGHEDLSTISGVMTQAADWQIVIYDAGVPVRTVAAGTGLAPQGDWDGLVDPGVLGDPGTLYDYALEGTALSDPSVTFASTPRQLSFYYLNISDPVPGAYVATGQTVTFTGTAAGTGTAFWELYYAWNSAPDNWIKIGKWWGEIKNGALGTWDVPETAETGVTMRLTRNGALDEQYFLPLQVFGVNSVAASPNPFGPNPDGNDDLSNITANLSLDASQWRVLIYDGTTLVREAAVGAGTAVAGTWDGLIDPGVLGVPGNSYKYEIEGTLAADPSVVLRSGQRPISFYYVAITDPVASTVFATDDIVSFTGTAAGTGFTDYTLEYALASAPNNWQQISVGTVQVQDGLLGTWTVPMIRESDIQVRLRWGTGPEAYTLPLVIFSIYDPLAYDHISPNADGLYDDTPIQATFTMSADWVAHIFDSTLAEVWTRSGTGVSVNEIWDGTDNGGAPLPEAAYTWRIDATSGGAGTGTPDTPIAIDTTREEVMITDPVAWGQYWESVPISVNLTNPTTTVGYRVDRAPLGTDPNQDTGWTNLYTSGTGFVSNPIYTWGTREAPDDDYLLRVVFDYSGGATSRHALPLVVDNLYITFDSINSRILDLETGPPASINFTVDAAATVHMKIFDEDGGSAGTLFKDTSQTYSVGGTYSLDWDGTDTGGVKVPDEAYVFVLEASDTLGRADSYDPPGGNESDGGSGGLDSQYNPYANDYYYAIYSNGFYDPHPARVRIAVLSPEFVWLVDREPHLVGNLPVIWDGRGVGGNILPGVLSMQFYTTERLRPHFIIVRGNSPRFGKVADPSFIVKTDPWIIHLSYGQFTKLRFALLDDADVTVKILPIGVYDPADPQAITLMSGQYLTPGEYEVEWDGLDPTDPDAKAYQFAAGGDLTFTVEATNPETGVTTLKRGALMVFD